MADKTWDFIVVGGGLAGSVVSSRVSEAHPELRILLIEAGSDVTQEKSWNLTDAATAPFLVGTELDWQDATIPQLALGNRTIPSSSGKALGGGTVINRGELLQCSVLSKATHHPQISYLKADQV